MSNEAKKHHKRDFKVEIIDMFQQPIFNPAMMSPDIFGKVASSVSEDARREIAEALGKLKVRPLTLFEVSLEALRYQSKGEEQMSASERQKRFNLMARLRMGNVKLSDDERDLLKAAIYKYWQDNLIAGQSAELLEGREFKPSLEPEADVEETPPIPPEKA